MTNQNEKVATSLGISLDALEARMTTVRAAQEPSWKAAGYDSDKIDTLVLRVSARQLNTEKTKIASSGATVLEGMFTRSPRYKDWGKMRYDSMKKQLLVADDEMVDNLVSQGNIVLFEDNHDGTFTRHINGSLRSKLPFEEGSDEDQVSAPHAKAVALDENRHFYVVADKNSPTWPSGDQNWRYGAPSPASDKKRTCYFLGRKQGSNDEPAEYQIVFSGDMAEQSQICFSPGTIAVKLSKGKNVGYAKAGVTKMTHDSSVASIFSNAPVVMAEGMPAGLMVDALGGLEPQGRFLSGFDSMPTYVSSIPESEKWTAYCGLVAEVVHIDPRDNGGYTITLGDLDILSSAPTQDVWIDADQEHLITFGVGSQLAIFGSVWMRDSEARFSTQSWYVVEAVEAIADDTEDGWDA